LKNRPEILSLLQALPAASKASDGELLEFIERNKLDGKGLSLVDVHLLASSCLTRASLWTRDKAIRGVAESLKLAY